MSNPNAADTNAPVAGLNPIVVMVNNLCPASSNEKDVSFHRSHLLFRSRIKLADSNLQFPVWSSDPSRYQLRRYAPHTLFLPYCSKTLTQASLGANVNFDLCKDDGAANALFGNSGIGMAFGKVTQVSCNLWTGSQNYTTGTMPSMPLEIS